MINLYISEAEYLEMRLLEERLSILKRRWNEVSEDSKCDYPKREFSLSEIEDHGSLISTLKTMYRVYRDW